MIHAVPAPQPRTGSHGSCQSLKLIPVMKYLVCFFLLASLATSVAVAQDEQGTARLSPLTRKYLREAKERALGDSPGHVNSLQTAGGVYLKGMIKVRAGASESRMRALGVRIGTKAGDIWTVQVPEQQAETFTRLPGIDYIQFDEPTAPTLDSARRATRVDSVHAGYGLPMPYNGENVVMGVVDAGFDYRHPTLLDTTGTRLRVKKVWEQKNSAGTPPAGYGYGTEITDSAAMWAKGNDNGRTHGTHVAGISSGSGFGSMNNRYRGMAYASDMVFVGITPDKSQWINTGASDMIDGINYIFKYAESVGKPAVVNLSWGSPLGPRDGTGLFSQALDNITGPGKIFVCSAGNNGDNSIHIQKKFTPADTTLRTFLNIVSTPVGRRTWVDIWGEAAKTFCVQVTLYKDTAAISTTGFICLDDTEHDLYLVGSENDTCFIDVITSTAEFNGKPRIFLDFQSNVSDDINITLKGTDGTVNMWTSFVHNTTGYYSAFTTDGRPGAVPGNSDISISDIAASKSAITVGAYASKTSWRSIAGKTFSYSSYVTRGRLVPFSSRGPAVDGRVKPDIIGPGLTIGSAISSYDSTFITGDDSTAVTEKYHNSIDGRDYPFGMLSGTSMSSPAVSGIVSMMLQIKPDLTPQQVKDIFTETAIHDNFTGTIPAGGNSSWGNGKVNAYGAVKRVLQLTSGFQEIAEATADCNVYPNPANGAFSIDYTSPGAERVNVEIYDLVGRPILSDTWAVAAGRNVRQFDLKESGIYFIKLSSRAGYIPVKVVVE